MARLRALQLPILLSFFALATPGSAQTVRGRLLEPDSETPIAAALVLLIDSAGRELDGVLTDDEGTFLLRAPGSGTYRLRAEHIAYRTTTSAPLELAAGESRLYRMAISIRPIELSSLDVEAERQCTVRPEAGLEMASLWEAARKALNAVRWTERGQLFVFEVVRYQSELDPRTRVVRQQQADTTWRMARPFVAANADDLVRHGFVQESPGDTSYYAPDADVLLSDAFLDTHCFEVRTRGEAGLIGLDFQPVPGRDVADVRGVLWLDHQTGALRSLDFQYTGLDIGVPSTHFGGRLEFERLPTGAWIIGNWSIRGPIIARGGWGRPRTLAGIKEVGGTVLQIIPREQATGRERNRP
jgi:hypothetical protein